MARFVVVAVADTHGIKDTAPPEGRDAFAITGMPEAKAQELAEVAERLGDQVYDGDTWLKNVWSTESYESWKRMQAKKE